MHKNQN